MDDPRYHKLNDEQLQVYDQIQNDPAAKEALLSIGARGNIKPPLDEIAAFLKITCKPKATSKKGSRVPTKVYECRLCPNKVTVRWDTAEYHIHGHLGLKTYGCKRWCVPCASFRIGLNVSWRTQRLPF